MLFSLVHPFLPLPFVPSLPSRSHASVCRFKTPPFVLSRRLRVCWHHVHLKKLNQSRDKEERKAELWPARDYPLGWSPTVSQVLRCGLQVVTKSIFMVRASSYPSNIVNIFLSRLFAALARPGLWGEVTRPLRHRMRR